MEILGRSRHLHLHRRHSPQAVGEGRHPRRDHRAVRDHRHIAGQLRLVLPEESGQARASDLLFPFDQENQIHRQIARLPQGLPHPEDVGQDLALVVGASPRGDDPVLQVGLEGRVIPERQRIDRLDIVMAVDQDRRSSLPMPVLPHHYRVARRRPHRRFQPDLPQLRRDPIGAAQQRLAIGRIGRNAGKGEKLEEIGEKTVLHGN